MKATLSFYFRCAFCHLFTTDCSLFSFLLNLYAPECSNLVPGTLCTVMLEIQNVLWRVGDETVRMFVWGIWDGSLLLCLYKCPDLCAVGLWSRFFPFLSDGQTHSVIVTYCKRHIDFADLFLYLYIWENGLTFLVNVWSSVSSMEL